ncbi:phosphotransferase family protein [Pseudonocardia ailaonensis]|uniref:Phosphotransferase family protein n=1 Tax=Pseudonocardia ailaonensis TaxID=367279 RepID=A0ABN2N384_9PSEU
MTVEGLDLAALEKHLADRLQGPLSAELVSGGRSNLTYKLTDGHSTWIARRPPLGTLTPSAHDMQREYRVVAGLHGSAVPVAAPVALLGPEVLGVQCAIVEYVPGLVLRSEADLAPLSDAEVERCAFGLVDTLAALHSVVPEEVGLGDLGRPQGYLARQIKRWYGQWEQVQTRPLADVETLHERLAATCPAESGAAIVHGDYRVDNAIVDPDDVGTVRALVDWEMATLGDPLADLALHLAYADPSFAPVLGGSAASTSPRMPGRDALVARYAAAVDHELVDLGFHLGLAYFKMTVIAEGIHQRHLRGDTRGEGFDSVGQAPAPLAAAGLTALGGSS